MKYRSSHGAWLAVALASVALPTVASAQLLNRASGTVHTGSSRSSGGRSSSSSSSSGGSSRYGGSRFFGRQYRLLPYPYAYGTVGYTVPVTGAVTQGGTVGFVASVEGGLTIPSVVRGGANVRLILPGYDFDVRYSFYVEPGATGVSQAALGRWDFAAHFIDEPNLQLRLHGGAVHWADAAGHELGFSGGMGIEFFPGEPFVLSFDLGGGSIGRAGMLYARGSGGWIIRNFELMVGWDHVSLITQDGSPWVNLSGPFAGLRVWL